MSKTTNPTMPELSGHLLATAEASVTWDRVTLAEWYDRIRDYLAETPDYWLMGFRLMLSASGMPAISWIKGEVRHEIEHVLAEAWDTPELVLDRIRWLTCDTERKPWSTATLAKALSTDLGFHALYEVTHKEHDSHGPDDPQDQALSHEAGPQAPEDDTPGDASDGSTGAPVGRKRRRPRKAKSRN